MTPTDLPLPDLPCNEFVELVTDYLEDALPPQRRAEVDQHLGICEGCRTVLDQWHEVVRLSGRVAEADVDQLEPQTRAQLMETFRRLRS